MHLVVLFHNVGGYHAARLRATHAVCKTNGWTFTALQVVGQTQEHPWGNLANVITFPLQTILDTDQSKSADQDRLVRSRLSAILDHIQPDVMAIPGWGFVASRKALSWCRRHRVPTILMSESKADDEPRHWWKEVLKSWLYVRHYDSALVGSRLHADYAVSLGIPSDRVFRGYDVVDHDYFVAEAEQARHNPDAVRQQQPQIPCRPYFLAVTRFIPRKNVSRLINAYHAYRQQVAEPWDLVLCGSGIEADNLQQQAQHLKLDAWVKFPGFVPYTVIAHWYGLAKALIHPALQEQWGLVVNEACAAGLPIICSDTVGARYDLVHSDKNGFLFNPNSTDDLTRCLVALHQLEETQRQHWGERSRAIASSYRPENFAEGMLQAADKALNHARYAMDIINM
ncbi:glycosyltransferase [Vacuolonema iberomarrocanum]|uniref:glycosyltransferase n=1 Tax=Vacuolonema iberomarrocanum TaxID=3454632 RepID=UPI0019FC2FA6|nr:glycosyltransferase [filamentous cyanobacterium LEGE 07170]